MHPRRSLALATALGCVMGGALTLHATSAQAATPVQVWLTTADGSAKLTRQPDIAFGATPLARNVMVSPAETHQTMAGFGASITGASASLIAAMPTGQRNALMADLFQTAGLNYLRQPIGATDFNRTADFYTYDDGAADPTLSRFSVQRDETENILPLVRQARQLNPALKVMGSPWSAPAWMKDSNNLNGGSLKSEYVGTYADYLVKFVQAYGAAGVPVGDLTVQNEPLFTTSYPSMAMSSQQQADLIKLLDSKLTAAGLTTRIWAYDHNWDRPDYPLDVFSRAGNLSHLVGAAFHCYGGQVSAQQQVVNAGKRVMFTECSGTDSADRDATFADTLMWHAENLLVQNARNGGESTITWNLALNPSGGPHQGGCSTRCNGVVEINGSSYTRNAEYYVLSHAARFVKPGAVRVGSTSSAEVQNVAFINPDGSRVLVALNTTTSAQPFSVTENGLSFVSSLPARSLATYTWPAPSGTPGDALSRTGWTATASVSAAGDAPARALDGNESTRWSTGQAQVNGQWFQVDLGQARTFTTLHFTSAGGDEPRGFQVYASDNPQSWGTAIASGSGAATTTVSFPTQTKRYLRIVQTGSAGNWWSIHELNLYS
ncbi:glycoside hydrolase family 30 beta sandwich domain-containing protein [Nonomuraea turcica]|uniref:glycoside hydrolase family 30 beta sandwich domain-containing protein n=1 Tax=Nonomuraea sp. G32 TaxID=3067274 RepID=UPI00273C971C|nr:glycoside hydrolase family 30 beta sandwich domain-containing protein [Nonomuraea sp. G32]MDP4512017.1 discoidin domain-containing protein [Nonomuraea sp. G32]